MSDGVLLAGVTARPVDTPQVEKPGTFRRLLLDFLDAHLGEEILS